MIRDVKYGLTDLGRHCAQTARPNRRFAVLVTDNSEKRADRRLFKRLWQFFREFTMANVGSHIESFNCVLYGPM